MAEPMSDEELYQLTGSWEAAAALRDEQARGANTAQAPVVEKAKPTTLSATPTLAELKAMYEQLGSTQARENYTEQGTNIDYIPVQYGGGWTAWDKAPVQIGTQGDGMDAQPIFSDKKELGGFSKQEGDWVTAYDLNGNVVNRQKWNENMLKSTIKDLGPMALMALTAGGGAGLTSLGELFGLTGTTAATAGGALAGGVNAWGNDQNVLKGALLGGVSGAGSAKLGDILGSDVLGETFKDATVGDATKAINFAQNPTLSGAVNLASPYIPNVSLGDGAISLKDVVKGVGTAQDLSSGNYSKIFKAITGMAGDQGKSLKSSLSGFDTNPDDFIEGYFQPGGEGYIDPNREEMTVREEPENIDALLRSLSPYATDDGKSIFTQTEEIPEMETVAKRPTSLVDLLGTPDILEEVPQDEPYIPSLRTKEIKSDIPDEITSDQIDTLFPNLDINDILQLVTDDTKKNDEVTECAPGFHDDGTGLCVADDDDVKEDGCPEGYILDLATNQCVKVGDTKVTVPPKTVVTPKTTTTTKTTEDLMASLGLGKQAPSQDPYANIKSMEDLFSGDIGYKLRALGVNPSQKTASTDMDELVKLLRG
jgi:hypothetical protein